MKKLLLIILTVIVIIPFILVSIIETFASGIIESYGTKMLKAEVAVGDFDISLLSGSASINGLRISNPEGFSDGKALSLDKVAIELDRLSLLSDTIIISSIEIDNPEISYEVNPVRGTNLGALKKNASAADSSPESGGDSSSSASKEGGEKGVIIDHLYIKGGKIKLAAAIGKGAGVTVPLPSIHLKDIGKEEGGVSFVDATIRVLSALIAKIGTSPETLLKGAAENIKSLTGAVGDVGNKLKGLFGK